MARQLACFVPLGLLGIGSAGELRAAVLTALTIQAVALARFMSGARLASSLGAAGLTPGDGLARSAVGQ